MLEEHSIGDTVVTEKKVRDIEVKMNHHLKQFNRMFRVGSTWGHQDRVAKASTSTNVPPPPAYGLRKDHKPVPEGQERVGPQVRRVVGANTAPNSRFGHFLSTIVNDHADFEENRSECRSSEEMRAAFDAFNRYDQNDRLRCKIISMDVRALYPSMDWQDIVLAVREMIENSMLSVQNVDWLEVGKYLSVMMTEEQIEEEGLKHVIPRRRGLRLRRITIRYLQQKKNNEKWMPARRPGARQQKKMLALAVSLGVYTVMSNHTYKVGDKLYLQAGGGPIGLELTGAVARPFMMRWDKLYLKKVKEAGLVLQLYERHIDDSNSNWSVAFWCQTA